MGCDGLPGVAKRDKWRTLMTLHGWHPYSTDWTVGAIKQ